MLWTIEKPPELSLFSKTLINKKYPGSWRGRPGRNLCISKKDVTEDHIYVKWRISALFVIVNNPDL
jgi:hypothetical protein